uniref:Beta-defensin-like domain-containing protein n=1 Tax=Chrysemys picta bellii TaxID=8478 RepID=A0A8C3FB39_CHRPI
LLILPLKFYLTLFLSAEFSQAQNFNINCIRKGGFCFFWRCPQNWKLIGFCSNGYVCCIRRRWGLGSEDLGS